jgi:hypothetical protein
MTNNQQEKAMMKECLEHMRLSVVGSLTTNAKVCEEIYVNKRRVIVIIQRGED